MRSDVIERLLAWPRQPLAHLPTPLRRAERLAEHLGVDRLYLKMDAETGFALGGNKVRKLEYELAPGRLDGVTHLITAGGPQSNHCRVTAAYAARFGLGCVLVVNGPAPENPTGNALLHRLFGADVVVVPGREDRVPAMDLVARRIEAEGGQARIVPIGASTPTGCLGYARAAIELAGQLDRLDDAVTAGTVLITPSSSCGTLAGLWLGLSLLPKGRPDVHVHAVSADTPATEMLDGARRIARDAAALLGGTVSLDERRVTIDDGCVGPGYGMSTPASLSATEDFGRLEGVVLDPTYTAKAAAGMIEWIRRRAPGDDRRLVFLHTGGAPGLMA